MSSVDLRKELQEIDLPMFSLAVRSELDATRFRMQPDIGRWRRSCELTDNCRAVARLAIIPSMLAQQRIIDGNLSSISLRQGVGALTYSLLSPLNIINNRSSRLAEEMAALNEDKLRRIFDTTARETFGVPREDEQSLDEVLKNYPALQLANEMAEGHATEQSAWDDRTQYFVAGFKILSRSLQRYAEEAVPI